MEVNVTPFWQGLGKPVDGETATVDELLEKAGAEFKVEKHALYFNGNVRVPGMYCIARDVDHKVYSVVGENYVPIAHRESFDFFQRLAKKGESKITAVGSLKAGQFIWALCETKFGFTLDGHDEVASYLLFTIPHQLGTTMSVQLLAQRQVSGATFPIPIDDDGGKTHRLVNLKSEEAVELEAERIFAATDIRTTEFRQIAQAATQSRPSDDDTTRAFLYRMLKLTPIDKQTPWKEHKLIRLMSDAMMQSPGSSLPSAMQNKEPTWWGVLSALAYTIDYQSGNAPDTRVQNSWFGWTGDAKRRAVITLAAELSIPHTDAERMEQQVMGEEDEADGIAEVMADEEGQLGEGHDEQNPRSTRRRRNR